MREKTVTPHKKKNKTLQIGVRITDDLYMWLDDQAQLEGLTVSTVARRVMIRAFNKEKMHVAKRA